MLTRCMLLHVLILIKPLVVTLVQILHGVFDVLRSL